MSAVHIHLIPDRMSATLHAPSMLNGQLINQSYYLGIHNLMSKAFVRQGRTQDIGFNFKPINQPALMLKATPI